MNLIEKLGGYDLVVDVRKKKTSNQYLDFNGRNIHFSKIDSELLEYRRENNIFEAGDLVVHPKFDNKKIYEIIEIKGDLFTVFYDRNSHSFRSDLRHATPEEIKAGHRL